MFYAKNVIGLHRLSKFISSHFGAIHSWNVRRSQKLQKTQKSSIVQDSKSFSVIQGHRCWRH